MSLYKRTCTHRSCKVWCTRLMLKCSDAMQAGYQVFRRRVHISTLRQLWRRDMITYCCTLSIFSEAFANSVVGYGIPAGPKSRLFDINNMNTLM